jgi:hypothetical protein
MSGRHKSKRNKHKQGAAHKQPVGDSKVSDKPEHVNVSGHIETHFPPELVKKYETGQSEQSAQQNTWNARHFWVGIGTTIIAFAYTTVAIWQACSNQKAADTASKSFAFTQSEFRMEQRPYLSAEGIGGFPEIGKDGKATGRRVAFESGVFKASVIIRNIGKSPAKNVLMTDMKYAYGPRDEVREKIKKYVPKYPDIPHLITMESYLSPILPNPDHFEIYKDDIPKYASGESEFYILGAVRYTDIFSPDISPYETTYCYKLNLSGMPFAECNWEAPYFTNSIK